MKPRSSAFAMGELQPGLRSAAAHTEPGAPEPRRPQQGLCAGRLEGTDGTLAFGSRTTTVEGRLEVAQHTFTDCRSPPPEPEAQPPAIHIDLGGTEP